MSSTTSILNDLISICKDGEQGFKKVAEEITNTELKGKFAERANGCAQAASELQRQVDVLGETPTNSGSFLGALHRGWIDVKSVIMKRDDLAILEECERGEDAAKKAYSKALDEDLPFEIRELIVKQFEGVKQSHDMVRDLRDQYAGKAR